VNSPLVLDKSYLDGAPKTAVRALCAKHTVLCSETLFYELMTTNPLSQIRCFSKLPEEPSAIALLPNVRYLLRFEMENKKPCGPLENHYFSQPYIFNMRLRLGTYQPPPKVQKTLDEWMAQVKAEAVSFLGLCQSVHQFFPELIDIEFRDFPKAVAAVKTRISSSRDEVRRVYESLRAVLPNDTPNSQEIDENWALYRWVQCQLFAALRIFERYQCRVPVAPSHKVIERAEHSMHDLQYVLIGALAGALASNDLEVMEDFRLVKPQGELVTSLKSDALVFAHTVPTFRNQ
jgi:hypothetical protein